MSLSAGFQPLYKQVYDLLTARLVDGYWKPSQLLPSEMLLAEELGVSQGTVRKALNQMVVEKMLQRQQGKGTFVAEYTQESDLFRFFRLREPLGEILIPETLVLSSTRRGASGDEIKKLNLVEELCMTWPSGEIPQLIMLEQNSEELGYLIQVNYTVM